MQDAFDQKFVSIKVHFRPKIKIQDVRGQKNIWNVFYHSRPCEWPYGLHEKVFQKLFSRQPNGENTWMYFIKILPERILTPQAPAGTHTGRMWSIPLSHLIKFTPQSHSNQIQKALQSTTHAVRCLSG